MGQFPPDLFDGRPHQFRRAAEPKLGGSVLRSQSASTGRKVNDRYAFPVLLGDIGGTNARFAVLPAPGAAIAFLPRTLTAQTPDPLQAINIALEAYAGEPPRSAMIAVATRVDAPAIRLTNAHWTIDAQAIGRGIGLQRVTL